MSDRHLLREQRTERLKALKAEGIQSYSGVRWDKTVGIKTILADVRDGREVQTAGRLIAHRSHGKTAFADLRDQDEKIQLYLKEDELPDGQRALLRHLDLGDILGVRGSLFHTKTGEPTIRVAECVLLAKALRPLPAKWHGLKDVELRYRQRYLDLLVNEPVRRTFLLRSRVLRLIRAFLDERGYLEVETPMMHPIAGGAMGEPFQTHHQSLDTDLSLRLAPELYLKRLLVGGFEKVYEMNRSFRNEGLSPRHHPEFTMLEVYCAYDNYEGMMTLTEELLTALAETLLGTTTLEYQGRRIELGQRPWRRWSFAEVLADRFGITLDDDWETWARKLQTPRTGAVKIDVGRRSRSQVLRIIEELLEPESAGEPVFVVDFLTELSPLAKSRDGNPKVAERFELFLGGLEVANGYSELNDPLEQRRRLEAQDPSRVDEEFVTALEYGMPPAGGLGIGIDRLVMLLANERSIRDVILFPQLRPTSVRLQPSKKGEGSPPPR